MSSTGDRVGFGAEKLELTPSTTRRSNHLAGRNDTTKKNFDAKQNDMNTPNGEEYQCALFRRNG